MQIKLTVVLLFLLMISCLPACQTGTSKPNAAAQVEGVLHISTDSLYLEQVLPYKTTLIATLLPTANTPFSIPLKHTEKSIYRLYAKNIPALVIIADTAEQLHIALQTDSCWQVLGSDENSRFQAYQQEKSKRKQTLDSLLKTYSQLQGTDVFSIYQQELQQAFKEVYSAQKRAAEKFIEQQPNTLAALLVINDMIGRKPLFTIEQDFKWFQLTDSLLFNERPFNTHIRNHHKRVLHQQELIKKATAAQQRLAIGAVAPPIAVTTDLSLSKTCKKNKSTLLYFWKATDARSRRANRQLIKNYPKWKASGTEIYGISLDPNPAIWAAALKLDQLPGIQVQASQPASVMKDYYITELPAAFLIDPDGNIMAAHLAINQLEKEINPIR